MGQSTVYFCEDCGFEVTETSTVFCLDFESRKVEEMSLGMLASNFIAGKVNGHVYTTYCSDCQSMIKRFVLYKNEFGINEEEIANFILDNYEGNELITVSFINGDFFEEYQISDNLNGQLKSKNMVILLNVLIVVKISLVPFQDLKTVQNVEVKIL